MTKPASLELATNLQDLLVGELRARVVLSVLGCSTTLSDHVTVVIRSGSDEQVVRTNTSWNIAPVTNEHSIRNRSVVNLPRDSMRLNIAPGVQDPKMAIAIFVFMSIPQPTRIADFWTNARPEPFDVTNSFSAHGYRPDTVTCDVSTMPRCGSIVSKPCEFTVAESSARRQ